MFFRYNTEPARLLRLFRAFRAQALRLKRYRVTYLLGVAAALLVYGLATPLVANLAGQGLFMAYFFFFGMAGGTGLLLAWWAAALFGNYPRVRRGHGVKAISVFGMIFGGIATLSILASSWEDLSPGLPLSLIQPEHRLEVLLPWAWSCVGLWLLGRIIVWLRLKAVFVDFGELDFLHRTLQPILRDLPGDTVCSLTCNPFQPQWTVDFHERETNGRSLRTYDDVLLDFKAKLADGGVFVLRTLHRRVDKYKIRKSKFKGSKHRIAQIYRLAYPAATRLDAVELQRFSQLKNQWFKEGAGFESRVGQDYRDGAVVLNVAQKKKFRKDGDLAAADLPGAALTLKTVRALSAFAAERRGETQRPP